MKSLLLTSALLLGACSGSGTANDFINGSASSAMLGDDDGEEKSPSGRAGSGTTLEATSPALELVRSLADKLPQSFDAEYNDASRARAIQFAADCEALIKKFHQVGSLAEKEKISVIAVISPDVAALLSADDYKGMDEETARARVPADQMAELERYKSVLDRVEQTYTSVADYERQVADHLVSHSTYGAHHTNLGLPSYESERSAALRGYHEAYALLSAAVEVHAATVANVITFLTEERRSAPPSQGPSAGPPNYLYNYVTYRMSLREYDRRKAFIIRVYLNDLIGLRGAMHALEAEWAECGVNAERYAREQAEREQRQREQQLFEERVAQERRVEATRKAAKKAATRSRPQYNYN